MSVAETSRHPAETAAAVPPRFCADGRYGAHFRSLAQAAGDTLAGGQVLRDLLVHLEAALDADDRVALYESMWQVAQTLPERELQGLLGMYESRYDPLIARLARPLHESTAWLARVHLEGRAPFTAEPVFVDHWTQAHGGSLEMDLLALHARLLDVPCGGWAETEALAQGQQTCLDAIQHDPALAPQAVRTVFALALAAGNERAALEGLIACVRHSVHGDLQPVLLQRWIEGGSEWPLQLANGLQEQWLQPALLHEAGYRSSLLASLQRPMQRARISHLHAALAADGAIAPAQEVAAPPAPLPAAWRLLGALDAVWARVELGEPIAEIVRPLIDAPLADRTRAALMRRVAAEAVDRIDPHAAGIALAAARAAAGDPRDTETLGQLLLAIDAPHVLAVVESLGWGENDPWFTDDPAHEEALWRALTLQPHEYLQTMAAYQLARLYTDGSLMPWGGRKLQRFEVGHALWNALAAHEPYAEEAGRRLKRPASRLIRVAESTFTGRRHLWVPSPEAGSDKVLVVFSCVESHHSFAQVTSLASEMHGHHLLFLNNPELNWYSDEAFEATARVIEERIVGRFDPAKVTCYYGSMGGHAALKFALHFGFQAVVFNPQVDLHLWAAFRPQQRAMLLGARRHASLTDHEIGAYERSPVHYIVGSGAPDREAFALWLDRVRLCRNGSFIVEKYPDPHHVALIARVTAGGRIPAMIQASQQRLRELSAIGLQPVGHAEVPLALVERFWQRLAQAPAIKLEILVRNGHLFVADSLATGTLPLPE